MFSQVQKKLLNIDKFSIRVSFSLLLILSAIVGIFASDLNVPSLPHIASYFLVSDTQAKYTISFYLLSSATCQLFYGSLSDAFGRRPILLIGLVIFVVGSLISALSPSIPVLMAGRLIQGAGAGGVFGLSGSIIRDCFSGKHLAQMATYITLTFSITLAIAPLIGGYLQHVGGWRWPFYFMLLYGFTVSVLCWIFFPETNRYKRKGALESKQLILGVKALFASRIFVGHLVVSSVGISGMIAYYTLSPFLFQNVLHVSVVTFGWLTASIAALMMLGKIFNIFMIRRFTLRRTIFIGCLFILLGGLSTLLIGLCNEMNVFVVVVPMMIYALGIGLVTSNAMVSALTPFPKMAGVTGSIYGSTIILSSFLTSTIAAHMHAQTQIPLGALLTGLGLIAVVTYAFILGKTPVGPGRLKLNE